MGDKVLVLTDREVGKVLAALASQRGLFLNAAKTSGVGMWAGEYRRKAREVRELRKKIQEQRKRESR